MDALRLGVPRKRRPRILLEVSPNAVEPLTNLIALSIARGDAIALAEYSQRLLELDPHSKIALQGLATQAMRRGNHGAAIEYCPRLVEVDRESFDGRSNLR